MGGRVWGRDPWDELQAARQDVPFGERSLFSELEKSYHLGGSESFFFPLIKSMPPITFRLENFWSFSLMN